MRTLAALFTALTLASCQTTIASAVASTDALHAPAAETLREYVRRPDAAFQRGSHFAETRGDGFRTYVLDFTSQSWRSADEVDRTTWRHWLIVVVPDEIKTSNALLLIRGGGHNDRAPSGAFPMLSGFAVEMGAVAVELGMVPSQPLSFKDKPGPRVEDDLIAYSWDKFLTTLDSDWIAQFPMTKSATNAMTVAQEVVRERTGRDLTGFVVTGASKRGWTTWLTAVADPRVVAIAPVVIDLLNVVPSMKHHHAVYGFWAEAIKDYVHHRITDRVDTPEMDALVRHIDPYLLRSELSVPKMIINAANDEFFLPDSSQFYFQDLPGQKHLRYVPNSGHNVNEPDVVMNLAALFEAVDSGRSLPTLHWESRSARELELTLETPVEDLVVWEAESPTVRDYRWRPDGPRYVARHLGPKAAGRHVISVAAPARGTKAWFVEATLAPEWVAGPYKLTTSIYVVEAP